MKIRFYLHSKVLPDKRRTIYCQYSHAGKRWRFSTNLTAKPSEWLTRTQRASAKVKHATYMNKVLDSIEDRIYKIAFKIREKGSLPEVEPVKASYYSQGASMSFWDAYDCYFSEYLAGMANNTIKHHKNTRNFLKSFEQWDNRPIKWEELNLSFITRFQTYLKQEGNSENTIRYKVKDMKAFLKYAEDSKWVKLEGVYKKWNSRPIGEGQDDVYLTREEVELLKTVELNDSLDKVRDLFLFQIGAGLRYSDMKGVKDFNLVDGVFSYYSPKVKKKMKVLLGKTALPIWEKYNGLPPVISNQNYNLYIKKACKLAGIIRGIRHKGEVKPKYMAITTHTGRRTFATLLLQKGVPINDVSRMMGHSSIAQTARYDKKEIEKAQSVLMDH